jgi:hypothetical protein
MYIRQLSYKLTWYSCTHLVCSRASSSLPKMHVVSFTGVGHTWKGGVFRLRLHVSLPASVRLFVQDAKVITHSGRPVLAFVQLPL